jgi:modulator of FtsH protease
MEIYMRNEDKITPITGQNYEYKQTAAQSQSLLATHSVLRNTYMLLSLTLLFSSGTAWLAMATNAAPMNPLFMILLMFGLLFGVQATKNSSLGLLMVFLFTGFMGYTLGPLLNAIIHGYKNGGAIIFNTLAITGATFLGLSAYALISRKNFSFLGNFLFVGLIVMIVASLANLFLHLPAMQLAIASGSAFIAALLILFDTSRIIHNGETNYISATVQLYLDIYLLFINLLQLFTAFSGRD